MLTLLVSLQNVSEAAGVDAEASNAFISSVLIALGALVLAVGLLFIIRKIYISTGKLPDAFQRVVLLVTVPKEHLELEEQTQRTQGGIKEMMAVAESLYANLGGTTRQRKWYYRIIFGRQDHIALEIVADQGFVSFFFATSRRHQDFVVQQIHAIYPEAEINEAEDYNIFSPQGVIRGTYLKLRKSNLFPIKTFQKIDADPMSALTNVLSKIREPEGAAIQILIRSAPKSWRSGAQAFARKVIRGKGENEGMMSGIMKSAFPSQNKEQKEAEKERMYRMSPMEEEKIKLVGEKTGKFGFETNIRVVVSASDEDRAKIYLDNIVNTFTQYTLHGVGNGFKKILTIRKKRILSDFIYRNFNARNKFVLNTEELTSIFHLPLPETETPNIRWALAKRSAPPVNLPTEGITLGKSEYRGQDILVKMKRDDRRRHVYMIGKSGVGKSVLISNMAIQDIQNGEGVCVVDPHGDLIEDILGHIPKERLEDVVIFNPSDMERPIGLNMLEADTPEERDFAVQEMISIFYKLFPPEMIGPMFEHNMRNVMLTLMADRERPGTIVEIPRMFTDPAYQKQRLAKVTDPVVRNFWEKEMAKTSDFHKSEMLGYLISKVGRFVENEMMRNIIGQSYSGFDFKEIMNQRKVLLVNLSKGKTGEVNSQLLGLIIVSKLQMAALARADLPQDQRHDFYLYIDEFQNFITDSIATILSEARKYRLNLIIAHQYIGQLIQGNDTKIRDAVLGNAGTVVSFKVGVDDAPTVGKIFAPVFNEYDAQNIEKYNAYVKLLIDNQSSRAFNMQTIPPVKGDIELSNRIKEISRMKYGKEKTIVEAEISERSRLGVPSVSTDSAMGSESKM